MSATESESALHWTISRAEWEGHVRRMRRMAMLSICALWGSVLLFGSFALIPWFINTQLAKTAGPSAPPQIGAMMQGLSTCFLIAWCVLFVFAALHTWYNILFRRKWNRLRELIWQSDGATCHWCVAPLPTDGSACRHALSTADSQFLRSYWEALATRDTQASLALAAEFPMRRGLRPQRLWRSFIRFTRWSMDPAAPLWRGILLPCVSFLPVFAILLWLGGFSVVLLSNALLVVIAMPLLVRGLGIMSRGRERCAKCRQQLAAGVRPPVCPECGGDLTVAGAVTSTEQKRNPKLIVAASAIGAICFTMPLLLTSAAVIAALPTSVVMVLAQSKAGFQAQQELSKRKLSVAEFQRWADLLLAKAETEPYVFNLPAIGNAVALGTLPPEYGDRLARVVLRMQVKGPTEAQVGAPVEVELIASSGPDGAPPGQAYAFLFTGWKIDEGVRSNALDHWVLVPILDPNYRKFFSPPPPESDYTFKYSFVPQHAGPLRVRATGWLTVGAAAPAGKDVLDAAGRPKLAALQRCYPVEAELTLQVE